MVVLGGGGLVAGQSRLGVARRELDIEAFGHLEDLVLLWSQIGKHLGLGQRLSSEDARVEHRREGGYLGLAHKVRLVQARSHRGLELLERLLLVEANHLAN